MNAPSSTPATKETFHPLVMIAGLCGVASVSIVALAFCLLRPITDSAMWAVACMTAAPALMGVALAYFLTRSPSQNQSSTQ